jgi:hypothetical protein
MPAALYPQEDSWYSFLLEAESTQGHSAAGGIRTIKKFSDLIGNRIRDLPAGSIVPQPTMLPPPPPAHTKQEVTLEFRVHTTEHNRQ